MNKVRLILYAVLMAIAEVPLRAFRLAMKYCTMKQRALPRCVRFALHPFQKRGHSKLVAGGRGFGVSIGFARAALVCMVIVAVAVTLLHGNIGGLMLFGGTTGTLSIDQKRENFAKLIKELEPIQEKMKAGGLTQAEGEAAEAKAKEAQALQADIDNYERIEGIVKEGKRVDRTVTPLGKEEIETPKSQVAGYVSVGDFVLAAPAFQKFAEENFPRGQHAVIQIDGASLLGKNVIAGPRGEPMVPLSRDQRKAFEEFLQTKAAPTLGTGVLTVERLPRVPQVTADDQLTLRDVIATGQTSASAVEYVREESHTQAAAETAHGSAKPEEALEYSLQTAAVRTIAAWMPVQNQQLEDMPQLRSLIEGRLRYSLRRREEYQLLWGSGVSPNIEGLFTVAGTTDISENGRYDGAGDDAHTLIDVVRLGITDVRVAGYEPNAVLAHPYDWEAMVLEKGTDTRYVWAVVTDENGTRIWGLRVVETVACQARTAYATDERRLIVGDFRMGAQLLDRMQTTIMVGLVNDQLIKNMRTILAEERVAFPIYAPAAFAWFQTQAAAT
jgi:HK97 family phage major capsid protein